MNSYWAGVIIGACFSTVFFTILTLVLIDQNQRLREQVLSKVSYIEKKVEEHEDVMCYFGWLKEVQEEEK